MKVGLVCPYDWSYPGGVRTHIIGLAGALEDQGIETEIIAPSTNEENGIFSVGGSVGVPGNGSIARICFSRSAAVRVGRRLAAGDLDLVHLHEPGLPSVSLLALFKARGLPVVATFHAARDKSLGYAAFRPILGRWLSRIDERITVSTAASELISSYFPSNYRLIPNGIQASRYLGAEPNPKFEPLKPFVLFVGRPEPRKGFEVLRAAVEEVRGQHEVRLVATIPPKAGLPAWVEQLGAVPDEHMPGLFASADVFCAPSLGGESFGIVLLEAMAAGAPVVASDLPGYREAAGQAAFLVPAGDPACVADGIRRVFNEPETADRLRLAGRDRARSLDWSVLVKEILDVYRQAGEHRMIA